MIVAAAVIGLLTAYYFGTKLGIVAAGSSAAAFVATMVIPGIMLYVYGGIALFVTGVLVLGPRMGRPGAQADFLRIGKRSIGWILKRVGKLR